jgi:hypothetical protein
MGTIYGCAKRSGVIFFIASAYNVAFWWSIGFTAIAIIPALMLSIRKNGSAIG